MDKNAIRLQEQGNDGRSVFLYYDEMAALYLAFGLSAYYVTMVTEPYISYSDEIQAPVALLRREHVLYLRQSMNLVVIGALIPFFLHNVFGQKSRMFIGDGGTLMLGMWMTVCMFYALSSTQQCDKLAEQGVSLSAFALAVLCIPVFDTLRVMTMRILRGKSPFRPDKTHLHHLFIDMGFSHLGAALFIILINFSIVLVWLGLWKMGASIDVQTLVVGILGFLVTFGFYRFMKVQQNGGPLDEEGYPQGTRLWHMMYKVGNWTHREKKRSWRILRTIVDGPLMGGK